MHNTERNACFCDINYLLSIIDFNISLHYVVQCMYIVTYIATDTFTILCIFKHHTAFKYFFPDIALED